VTSHTFPTRCSPGKQPQGPTSPLPGTSR
jgi:hypothetical protein